MIKPIEVVGRFIGRSHAAIRAQVADRLGTVTAAIWSERFEELHREAVDSELAPVEGLMETLDAIALPTCVASSGTHDKMRHTLGRTGLYDRFAGRIYSATEVSRGKPAPDLFLHAARSMGVEPAACPVYGPRAPRGCVRSGTRGDLRPPSGWRGPAPSCSATCGSCPRSSPSGNPVREWLMSFCGLSNFRRHGGQ